MVQKFTIVGKPFIGYGWHCIVHGIILVFSDLGGRLQTCPPDKHSQLFWTNGD